MYKNPRLSLRRTSWNYIGPRMVNNNKKQHVTLEQEEVSSLFCSITHSLFKLMMLFRAKWKIHLWLSSWSSSRFRLGCWTSKNISRSQSPRAVNPIAHIHSQKQRWSCAVFIIWFCIVAHSIFLPLVLLPKLYLGGQFCQFDPRIDQCSAKEPPWNQGKGNVMSCPYVDHILVLICFGPFFALPKF